MRGLVRQAAGAVGTFVTVGIGVPVITTLMMPVFVPVVVAAAAGWVLSRGGR